MNCAACGKLLDKREHAQPTTIAGRKVYPRSCCDACCESNLWPPGSSEALNRLAYGDPKEPAAT